jgi:lysophospholipase
VTVAPLIAVDGAPVPTGGGAEWFMAKDGARLRVAVFAPAGASRGSVVISTGRIESIEKYFELVGEFLARGWTVLLHDWRGQGLSDRPLPDRMAGHAVGFDAFVRDYRDILTAYADRLPRPWIAVGHSMGGCLTLLALAKGEDRFQAAILSAPMLGIAMEHPRWLARLVSAGRVLIGHGGRYVPRNGGDPFYQAFDGNRLTHDRARFQRFAAQVAADRDLALGGPTWSWLNSAMKATAWLARPSVLPKVKIPVVILSAGEDQIVLAADQALAAERLPKGKLVSVPGARHEILQETDAIRAVFWREFDALTR